MTDKIKVNGYKSTVIYRIKCYVKKHNPGFTPTLDQKQTIGTLAIGKLFSDNKKHWVYKIKVKEPEGKFEVVSYPSRFVPVLDSIIHNYFKYSLT